MSATTAGWFRSSTSRLRARHRFRSPLGRSHGRTPCRVSPSRLRMFQGILVFSNGRTDQFGQPPAKLRPRPTSLGRRSECALGTMLLPQPRKSPRTFGSRFPTPLNGPIRRRLHGLKRESPFRRICRLDPFQRIPRRLRTVCWNRSAGFGSMAVGTVAGQTQVAGVQAGRRVLLGLHEEGPRSGRTALPGRQPR